MTDGMSVGGPVAETVRFRCLHDIRCTQQGDQREDDHHVVPGGALQRLIPLLKQTDRFFRESQQVDGSQRRVSAFFIVVTDPGSDAM
jgi:hypothetical protein